MVERARRAATEAVEVRRGWRYLCLTPSDDEPFDEAVFAGLRWFVGEILAAHRHEFCRFGESAVVAIGPPDAEAHARRLTAALHQDLSAVDAGDDIDARSRN